MLFRSWPEWFRPTAVEYAAQVSLAGAFGRVHPLTRAGDVLLVPTPGHSYGHQSVLLLGEPSVLFAGDVSFDQAQMYRQQTPGISSSMSGARQSLAAVRRHLDTVPTVYLPSHDPSSLQRLRTRQVASPQ